MPRRTSTNSLGNNKQSEEGTPTLPTLTRAQLRRFISEQRIIISALIKDYSPDRVIYYTTFDSPEIVNNDELGDILGVEAIIYEIIFDQKSRNIFVFYIRELPDGTFTRCWGERGDISDGPPRYDSDGNSIRTDEESDIYTDKESNAT
jgi:hypothetical protein